MTAMALKASSLRAQADTALEKAAENGRHWAQQDLRRWQRTIRRRAKRGYRSCDTFNLGLSLTGGLYALLGPDIGPAFMTAYADELRSLLGDGFTIDYSGHGGLLIHVSW